MQLAYSVVIVLDRSASTIMFDRVQLAMLHHFSSAKYIHAFLCYTFEKRWEVYRMEQQFQDFLKQEGYSEYTPSGNKSTVYDYAKRVNRVRKWEHLSWYEISKNIASIVALYDTGGSKEELGMKSNHAFINALKAFQRFVTR